jgi:DNA-binding NarL/FixJ family response regulator/tRNA A-37 threonylcarbamoyl transferase component Bud32
MSNFPSILLVEDQKLLRLGLKVSLEKAGCYQILGEVGDGESAISEAQRLRPEIILMDIGLPGMDGIETTRRIKQELPQTHVIMFTSNTTSSVVTAALGAGADGYCTKDTPLEQISIAIETVKRGEIWLDPSIADAVARYHDTTKDTEVSPVAEMETQVLALIKQGLDNNSIAKRLQVTPELVARTMHNIIHGFVQKSRHEDVTIQNATAGAQSWLTLFPDQLNDGTMFADKYKIEGQIGHGGIGAVYKAKHVYMDRYVALKILRPELSDDRIAIRNFQREAKAIANVQHKNIVAVHDFGISQRREPFLIMEYVEGTNLADILEKQTRLKIKRLMPLCLQTCNGLVEAHKHGIIHCDLKPSNILISGSEPDEQVKLVDFGIAQIVSRESTGESGATEIFVSGTPTYMSPEQCMGKRLDLRSDIYSLGCVLYESLTGVNIFRGETSMETLTNQCQFIPPPMASIYAEGQFSPRLEDCVQKMLAKDPAKRFQSMEEVKDTMLHVMAELGF